MPVSARDAAVVGWLATDGTVRYEKTNGIYYRRAHIDQSKPHYVNEIRELLGGDATESVCQNPPRRFPSGQVSTTLESHRFSLKSEYLRDLLAALKLDSWSDLPGIVTRLAAEARAAMFDAMLKGDGSVNSRGRWEFGKRRKPGVMEAWEILATLQGYALGKLREGRVVETRVLRKGRLANANYIQRREVEPAPVWCPTTPLGTWYMRQGSTIMITGNTRAKARALRDAVNISAQILEDA
jgi:hypothetical protein